MDNSWNRNPSKSEVIGHCGGDVKTSDHADQTIFYFFYRSSLFHKRNIINE